METNELTPRILKMTTKTGFVELFWEAVNADQQQHTHEEIYDILEKEYQGLIDDWEEVWEPEYYNKNLKMISLGILFQADSAFAQAKIC